MERIEDKVNKHEIEINYIKSGIDKIVKNNEIFNKELQKISESIIKQEAILSKLSDLEKIYNDGIKRTHLRLDKIEDKVNKKNEKIEQYIEELKMNLIKTKDEVKSNDEIIKKDIEEVKKQIEKHNKLIYSLGYLVIAIIVTALVKGLIKI